MFRDILAISYAVLGGIGLFFQIVTPDLLSLGMRSEYASMIAAGVTVTLTVFGWIAIKFGVSLPDIRIVTQSDESEAGETQGS